MSMSAFELNCNSLPHLIDRIPLQGLIISQHFDVNEWFDYINVKIWKLGAFYNFGQGQNSG